MINDKLEWLKHFITTLGYKLKSVGEVHLEVPNESILLTETKNIYIKGDSIVELVSVSHQGEVIDNFVYTNKEQDKGEEDKQEIIYEDKQKLYEHFREEIRERKLEYLLNHN